MARKVVELRHSKWNREQEGKGSEWVGKRHIMKNILGRLTLHLRLPLMVLVSAYCSDMVVEPTQTAGHGKKLGHSPSCFYFILPTLWADSSPPGPLPSRTPPCTSETALSLSRITLPNLPLTPLFLTHFGSSQASFFSGPRQIRQP